MTRSKTPRPCCCKDWGHRTSTPKPILTLLLPCSCCRLAWALGYLAMSVARSACRQVVRSVEWLGSCGRREALNEKSPSPRTRTDSTDWPAKVYGLAAAGIVEDEEGEDDEVAEEEEKHTVVVVLLQLLLRRILEGGFEVKEKEDADNTKPSKACCKKAPMR